MSKLFGKEILPECTFESEYGKLKFNSVIVPYFPDKASNKNFEQIFFMLKALMRKRDLLKKMNWFIQL